MSTKGEVDDQRLEGRMRLKRMLIGLFPCVAFVVFILFASSVTWKNRFAARARGEIMILGDAINAFVDEKRTIPMNLVGDATVNAMTSNCIQTLLCSHYLEGGRNLDKETLVWLDPWGNPYKLAFRECYPRGDLFCWSNSEDDCVVWSSGKNRINEVARGDDIVKRIRFDTEQEYNYETNRGQVSKEGAECPKIEDAR